MNRGDTTASRATGRVFHLAGHFHQEQQLAIARARGGVTVFEIAPVVLQRNLEARVDDFTALLDVLLLRGPALSIGTK